jgi:hypothetical protein
MGQQVAQLHDSYMVAVAAEAAATTTTTTMTMTMTFSNCVLDFPRVLGVHLY